MTQPLLLSDGAALPSVGLGLWKLPDDAMESVIPTALELGYRHFDGACDYGNEASFGKALNQAIAGGACSRDEVWLTSKLWNTYHRPEHVRPAIEKTLSDLGQEHLDLYLIHFPITLKHVPIDERYPPGWFFDPDAANPHMEFDPTPLHETYSAMEDLVTAGLTKRIGVCNYNTALLQDLVNYAKIAPTVLQVEMHPLLAQQNLLRFASQLGVAVTAYSPLGSPSYVPLGMAAEGDSLLDHPTITTIANTHGKSPAQVLLRWGVQRGTAVIPKSTNPARLKENIELFDFELSEAEMTSIAALDQHRRFNDPAQFGPAAFNTFCPIYD